MASAAAAINNAGTVIVGSSHASNVDARAVRWVLVNGVWIIQSLGTLPGATNSQASDISENGAIVGFAQLPSGTHGFLWQNGVITDLGPVGVAQARGLNDVGQVVGVNANNHAVLWTQADGATELGTLGGSSSFAWDVNGSGEVVGSAATSSNVNPNVEHAFLWTRRKGMQDLGTLPGGSSSRARAINEIGQVVGQSTIASAVHGFLWAKGKMLDLGVLAGYDLSDALAVNDAKQIVGLSVGAGGTRATLWTIK